MKRLVAGATMLAALFAAPVAAQGIGVAVGTLIPQGDLKEGAKNGFSAIASIELGGRVAIRGEALWANSSLDGAIIKTNTGIPVPEDADVSGTVKVIGGLGSVVLHFGTGFFQPYILGGAGYYNRSVSQDAPGAATEFKHLNAKGSDLGYHFGGGVKLSILGISAFGEVRYHTVKIKDEQTNFIPLIVGIRF